MNKPSILLLFICFFCLIPDASAEKNTETDNTDTPQDYRVGPGDVLAISVFGQNDFDQIIRISNSGKVHIRHLGILKVNNMSISSLQEEIKQNLLKKDLLKNPWVQVRVVEYRAHPVYILGEVMQPGQFLIKDEMYISDLISLTAGFNDVASPIGYLYRHKINDSDSRSDENLTTEEAIPINFEEMYNGNKPELNLKLRGGDVLYVPQRQPAYFYIVGEVQNPRAFEIPFGQQMLASQAISKAGGPLKTAKMSEGMLLRYDENGTRHERKVDFSAILKGKMPDFEIVQNDIIFIPGSNAKTLGYGMLDVVPRIAFGFFIF